MSEKHCRKPENVFLLPPGNVTVINTDAINNISALEEFISTPTYAHNHIV
jgi:hypothetical protein